MESQGQKPEEREAIHCPRSFCILFLKTHGRNFFQTSGAGKVHFLGATSVRQFVTNLVTVSLSPLSIGKINTKCMTDCNGWTFISVSFNPLDLYFPFFFHVVSMYVFFYPTIIMYAFQMLFGLKWDINEFSYHYYCWAWEQTWGPPVWGKTVKSPHRHTFMSTVFHSPA